MLDIHPILREHEKTLTKITSVQTIDATTGKVSKAETSSSFTGVIMPITSEDIQYSESGTFTAVDRKVYTRESFKAGNFVVDNTNPQNVKRYKILEPDDDQYGLVNSSFRRYFLKRVGGADG